MKDRIERYLAGTLGGSALTAEERAQADAVECVGSEARAFVNGRPGLDLTGAVMRRVEQHGAPRGERPDRLLARLLAVLWTPQPVSFQFRPVYALVSAAVFMVGVGLLPGGWRLSSEAPSSAAAPAAAEPQLLVQFRFLAPDASSVQLAGSFSDWEPRFALVQTAPGNWTVTLPLPPGVHDYSFVVDGQRWMPDPFAPSVNDGFGGVNSRLSLLPPEDARL